MVTAGVLRLAYFFLFASFQSLSGDENYYFSRAADVINLAYQLGAGLETEDSVARLLWRGWFMPGMSIVLAPLRLMTPDLAAARLYVGCLNFALLVVLVRLVRRQYGGRSAFVVASLLGLFPAMIVFSFTLWGECLAGQLIVVALLVLNASRRSSVEGARSWLRPLWVGLLVLVIVYLRPGFIIMVPVAALVLVFLLLHSAPSISSVIRRSTAAIATLTAVVLIGIAPWSYALSKDKGGLFLTTTTVGLNAIIGFGRDEDVNAVKPEVDPRLYAWHEWIDEKSERSGESYAEILSSERRRILSRVTLAMYQRTLRRQLEIFFLEENQFFDRFVSQVGSNPESTGLARSGAFSSTVRAVNSVAWRLMLLFGLVLLAMPLSAKRENWWPALHFKIAFLALSSQPFVSIASGRYYMGMVPLLIVTLGVMTEERFRMIPLLWRDRVRSGTVGEKGVALLQVGVPVLLVSLVLLIQPW